MDKVILSNCKEYGKAKDVLEKSIKQIGGIEKFIKKDDKVLLKLNLLMGKPKEACVSPNPEFVEALIIILQKAKAKVFAGDSPAAVFSSESVLKANGTYDILKKHNVKIVDLKTPKIVSIPNGKKLKNIEIAKELDEFDKIINVAKLKTHGLCAMTLCAKNLYGCVPGLTKVKYHIKYSDPQDFSQMILDLNKVVKPTLNIVDGIIGMEGQGPAFGTPRNLGIIGISTNALALDFEICKILSVEKKVPICYLMEKNKDLPNYKVTGKIEKIKDFKLPRNSPMGIIPEWIQKKAKNAFFAKPDFKWEICKNCNNCVTVCGPHALTKYTSKSNAKENPHPNFDKKKCIMCYCCHEICPYGVITIKNTFLSKLLFRK